MECSFCTEVPSIADCATQVETMEECRINFTDRGRLVWVVGHRRRMWGKP